MRSSVTLCLLLLSFSLFAQTDRKLQNGQLAYYGSEFYNGKVSKESLFKILNESHSPLADKHDVISNTCQGQSECFRHTSVGYDSARKIMFGELFKKQDTKGTFVEDVYCEKKFYYKAVEDISNMGREVNIEHTWPQSKFSSSFEKNMQKSDMHHLYPTDSDANNRRGNHEFGEVDADHDELNVNDCSSSRLSDFSGHFMFTPPEVHRGNVARSLFYFSIRYKLPIGPAQEMILRQWHKADPIDQGELTRHEQVAKYQKVRNPFLDFPQLIEKISDF